MLRLTDFIIDCPEPLALAGFYSEVVGLPIAAGSTAEWASIDLSGVQAYGVELAFVPVADYRPPKWPDSEHPKQFHLDFEVDLIEPEQARLLALGATLRSDHIAADGYGFRVYLDPVGHPFCLCRNRGVQWVDGRPRWPGSS